MQYFNKEEHAKLEALVKKLRRQIEVSSSSSIFSFAFRSFCCRAIQPTADEQSVDRNSLQNLQSQHKVAASDSVRTCDPFRLA